MRRGFILLVIIAVLVILSPAVLAQSSLSGQHRIIRPIMINGQSAQGALIVENGVDQTYSCQSPQPYVTTDQSESGWACFDASSGLWLLHAQPSSSAAVPSTQESPTVIYSDPNTVNVPTYDYGYLYPYYPYGYYGYPYFWGPRVGLGFAFNFGPHVHCFHNGHGFVHRGGGFAHTGPAFGHGGGGFVHGGGGFAHGFAHGGGGFGGHMGGGGRR